MAEQLSALVTANNDITSVVNSFNNTFENLVKQMKEQMSAVQVKLLADGGYANFAAAKADIPNEMSVSNATIATQTYTQAQSLFVTLNTYNETDPIATRAAAVEAIMIKVVEVVPLMARV